jgi:hypothetical protein
MLGPLVRVVTNFMKNNPTQEGAPKFAELLKRIDVTRGFLDCGSLLPLSDPQPAVD